MAFRGGYGSYYRGQQADVDPLAAAIASFHSNYQEQRAADDEKRTRAAAVARQMQQQEWENQQAEARAARDADQWDVQKRRWADEDRRTAEDRVRDAKERATAENDRRGKALLDAGYLMVPGAAGGVQMIKGPSAADVADARQVRVAKALQGVRDEAELGDLRGAAKAAGVTGFEAMGAGELRQRIGMASEDRAQRRALAVAGARTGGATGRKVPATVAASLGAYNNILGAAEAADQAFTTADSAKLNVSGPIRGRVAPVLQNLGWEKIDPRETSARATLANIASEIMRQRSGGAITDSEFERLQPFMPSANDTEDLVRQKLTDLKAYLARQRDTALDALEDGGYDVRSFRRRAAGGAGGGAGGGSGDPLDELDGLGR